MMHKSNKIAAGIIIAFVIVMVLWFIHGVMRFFGYRNPVERYYEKTKAKATLEKRYPEHDFEVEGVFGSGEYGYYHSLSATDEDGVEFRVQWVEGELQDWYHEAWNEANYGKKLVEYQNDLRDKYFPKIPYVDTYEYSKDDEYEFAIGPVREVFFESMEEAIEESKRGRFDTSVTFKDIDIITANDDEIMRFADSIADSLMWLHDETGYSDVRINDFHYIVDDENVAGSKTKDELIEDIIREIERDRKYEEQNKDNNMKNAEGNDSDKAKKDNSAKAKNNVW